MCPYSAVHVHNTSLCALKHVHIGSNEDFPTLLTIIDILMHLNIFNTEHNVQSIKTIQSEYKYAHRSVLVHGIPETSRTSQNVCYSIRIYVFLHFTICGIFGEHFSSVIQAYSEWRWAGVTVTGRQQPSS